MRNHSIFSVLFFLIISIGLQSCKKSPSIDENKFVKLYTEMIFMQDTSSLSQLAIKDSVLKKFSVKEFDYVNTVKFYNDDPERWQRFFDSTLAYMERLKPNPKKIDEKSLQQQPLSEDKKNL
jgi:hypothetical protein